MVWYQRVSVEFTKKVQSVNTTKGALLGNNSFLSREHRRRSLWKKPEKEQVGTPTKWDISFPYPVTNKKCYFLWEWNSNLPQCSCLENTMERGVWWATVHGVTKSQTQLSDWAHTHISCRQNTKEERISESINRNFINICKEKNKTLRTKNGGIQRDTETNWKISQRLKLEYFKQ